MVPWNLGVVIATPHPGSNTRPPVRPSWQPITAPHQDSVRWWPWELSLKGQDNGHSGTSDLQNDQSQHVLNCPSFFSVACQGLVSIQKKIVTTVQNPRWPGA